MTKEELEKDCTDCKHYAICYLRRHKDNDNPCEDFEEDEWMVEEND